MAIYYFNFAGMETRSGRCVERFFKLPELKARAYSEADFNDGGHADGGGHVFCHVGRRESWWPKIPRNFPFDYWLRQANRYPKCNFVLISSRPPGDKIDSPINLEWCSVATFDFENEFAKVGSEFRSLMEKCRDDIPK